MSLWEMPTRWEDTVTNDQYQLTMMDESRPISRESSSFSCFPSTMGGAHPSGASAVPTPPDSDLGLPSDERSEASALVSVSTTFNLDTITDDRRSDLLILSSDSVLFYVHSARLLEASGNGFNGNLPLTPTQNLLSNRIIALPERASVINLLLCAVYFMPCTHYSPSFEDLSEAMAALGIYGLPIQTFLTRDSPLFDAFLIHAPTRPLDLYAFAATNRLHDLAVITSPHLLSLTLSSLTDEMAVKIGPIYLKKLFFLHLGRTDALKQLLQSPPRPHAPTSSCGFEEQRELTRAWALASAYLTWNARPHTGASTIESALRNLANHLTCEICKLSVRDRVHDLVVQWSTVKRTII